MILAAGGYPVRLWAAARNCGRRGDAELGEHVGAPSGTVTFVLTDVVDSTALWQQFPGDMAAALATHEQILRSTFETHGGYEFGTAGDSFAVAFDDAARAVRAVVDIQRALGEYEWGAVPIHVRIGLHSGQSEERDGKYFGPSVNLAARIEALAGPGQILMSRATQALTERGLADDIRVIDLGEHQLKSFDEPFELFQLAGPGLVETVTLTADTQLVTLPRPSTRFVGRESDIAALSELAQPGALVTVTGMGGLGKTRIAIEAANAISHTFADGVWWVDLTPLTPGAPLATHLATTLGLTQQPGMDPVTSVVDGLARQTVVIVLDNCEHVLDDVGTLVDHIRRACPSVCLIATSQAPLGVAGEMVLPLAPLDASSDAVALLIARATANDARFDAEAWPRQDLVDLCARLDGLPLAIEMAAARLRALSPRDICDRLDDRFRILKSKSRGTVERHQSLLAALDWSYDLLGPDEQIVLDRLSIFAGTFNLAAAAQVCADDSLDEFDVLELVTDLLEKSLITQAEGDGTTRYRMLESVRHYCDGHLTDQDREVLRRALVDYCVDLATENDHKWLGDTRADFDQARVVYANEWNNFREAVRWAVAFDDDRACDAIFQALWAFSFETFRNEIGDWGRTAMALTSPPVVVLGACAMTSASPREADELLKTAIEQVDEAVPDQGASFCYSVLALTYHAKGDPQCVDYARRGRFHAQAIGDSEIAFYDANLAGMLIDQDQDEAESFALAAMDYIDRASSPMRATCVPPLAWYEAKRGRPEVGYDLCMRAVAMCDGAGIYWAPTMALAYRARISMKFGVGDQHAALREAIEKGRDNRAWFAVWLALGESMPWLREHSYHDAAQTIESYMDAKGMWYRRPKEPVVSAPAGAAARSFRLKRDELIDFVLAELGG